MYWWCKGSTLSSHVRGVGFDSRVWTPFSIDLCCIYLVFAMLLIFVKGTRRRRGVTQGASESNLILAKFFKLRLFLHPLPQFNT